MKQLILALMVGGLMLGGTAFSEESPDSTAAPEVQNHACKKSEHGEHKEPHKAGCECCCCKAEHAKEHPED